MTGAGCGHSSGISPQQAVALIEAAEAQTAKAPVAEASWTTRDNGAPAGKPSLEYRFYSDNSRHLYQSVNRRDSCYNGINHPRSSEYRDVGDNHYRLSDDTHGKWAHTRFRFSMHPAQPLGDNVHNLVQIVTGILKPAGTETLRGEVMRRFVAQRVPSPQPGLEGGNALVDKITFWIDQKGYLRRVDADKSLLPADTQEICNHPTRETNSYEFFNIGIPRPVVVPPTAQTYEYQYPTTPNAQATPSPIT